MTPEERADRAKSLELARQRRRSARMEQVSKERSGTSGYSMRTLVKKLQAVGLTYDDYVNYHQGIIDPLKSLSGEQIKVIRDIDAKINVSDAEYKRLKRADSSLSELDNEEINKRAAENTQGLQFREDQGSASFDTPSNAKGVDTSGGVKEDRTGLVAPNVADSGSYSDEREEGQIYKKYQPDMEEYNERAGVYRKRTSDSQNDRRRAAQALQELSALIDQYGYDGIPGGRGGFLNPEDVYKAERNLRRRVNPVFAQTVEKSEAAATRREDDQRFDDLALQQLRAVAEERMNVDDVREYTLLPDRSFPDTEQGFADARSTILNIGKPARLVLTGPNTLGIELITTRTPEPNRITVSEADQVLNELRNRKALTDARTEDEVSQIQADRDFSRKVASVLNKTAKLPQRIVDKPQPNIREGVVLQMLQLPEGVQGPLQIQAQLDPKTKLPLAPSTTGDDAETLYPLEKFIQQRALFGEMDEGRKDLTNYRFANAGADIGGELKELGAKASRLRPYIPQLRETGSPAYQAGVRDAAYYQQISKTGVRTPQEALDLIEGAEEVIRLQNLQKERRTNPEAVIDRTTEIPIERSLQFLGYSTIGDKDQLTNLATALDQLTKSMTRGVNVERKSEFATRASDDASVTAADILFDTKKGQDVTTLEKLGLDGSFMREKGRAARQAFRDINLTLADKRAINAENPGYFEEPTGAALVGYTPEGVDPGTTSSLSAMVKRQPKREEAAKQRLRKAMINLKNVKLAADTPSLLPLPEGVQGPLQVMGAATTSELMQARKEYEDASRLLEAESNQDLQRQTLAKGGLGRYGYISSAVTTANNGKVPQSEQELIGALQRVRTTQGRPYTQQEKSVVLQLFRRQQETASAQQSQGDLMERARTTTSDTPRTSEPLRGTGYDNYFMEEAARRNQNVEIQREREEIGELIKLMTLGAQYDQSDYRKFMRMPDIEFNKLGQPTHKKGDKLVVPRREELGEATVTTSDQTQKEIARFAGFLSRDPKSPNNISLRRLLKGLPSTTSDKPSDIRVTTNLNPEDRRYLQGEVYNYLAAQNANVNLDSGSWNSIRQQLKGQASPAPTPQPTKEPGSWMGGSGSGAIAPSPFKKTASITPEAETPAATDPAKQARIARNRLRDIEAVSDDINQFVLTTIQEGGSTQFKGDLTDIDPVDTIPRNIMDIFNRSGDRTLSADDVDTFTEWVKKEIPNDPVALGEFVDGMSRFPREDPQPAPSRKAAQAPKASGPDVVDQIIKKYRAEFEAGGPVNKKGDLATEGLLASRQIREQREVMGNRKALAQTLLEGRRVLDELRSESAPAASPSGALVSLRPSAKAAPEQPSRYYDGSNQYDVASEFSSAQLRRKARESYTPPPKRSKDYKPPIRKAGTAVQKPKKRVDPVKEFQKQQASKPPTGNRLRDLLNNYGPIAGGSLASGTIIGAIAMALADREEEEQRQPVRN